MRRRRRRRASPLSCERVAGRRARRHDDRRRHGRPRAARPPRRAARSRSRRRPVPRSTTSSSPWTTPTLRGRRPGAPRRSRPTPLGLPLAAARNLGAEVALDRGADVAGLPRRRLPRRTRAWSRPTPRRSTDEPDTVWSGPVTYLPAAGRRLRPLATSPTSTPPTPPGPHRRSGSGARRRPRPVLVAVLRAAPRRRGGGRAGSARTTSATAARTPTSVASWSPPGSTWAGSARPGPSTSSTPSRGPRSSTSSTSCATPRSSAAAGAPRRCWAGCVTSSSTGSSAATTRGAGPSATLGDERQSAQGLGVAPLQPRPAHRRRTRTPGPDTGSSSIVTSVSAPTASSLMCTRALPMGQARALNVSA